MMKIALRNLLLLPFLIWSFNFASATEPGDIKLSIIDEDVIIEWTGFSGINSYVIEVATNADQSGQLVFSRLAKVESDAPDHRYSYVDCSSEKSGIRYYRIKHIQKESKYILSEVKTANFLFRNNFTLNVIPDYNQQIVFLEVNSKSGGEATIKLSEMSGEVLLQEKATFKSGFTKKEIIVPVNFNESITLFSFSHNGDTQHIMLRKNPVQNFMVVSEE